MSAFVLDRLAQTEIVLGGVNGKHAGIFSKKISFSGRKNPYFADFTAGIQRIQVKSGGGGSGGGRIPPSAWQAMF